MKQTPPAGLYARLTQNPLGGGPVTVSPPPILPAPPPRIPYGAWIVGAGLIIAALIEASSNRSTKPQPEQPKPPTIDSQITRLTGPEVRRAQPEVVRRAELVHGVPRAEAVGPGFTFDEAWFQNPSNRDGWFTQIIPCQSNQAVWIHYRGLLKPGDSFPANPRLWDEYHLPNGSTWIWMVPLGAVAPRWIDP